MGVALLTLLIGGTYLFARADPVARVARGRRRWRWPRSRRCGPSRSRPTRRSASSPSSIRAAIRWRRATRRTSRASRSARAGCSAPATCEGTQTQLRFLPTQHTDFAFSVVAEEWGFAGSCGRARRSTRRCCSGGSWWRAARRTSSARCSRSAWSGACSGQPCSTSRWCSGSRPVIGVPLPLFSYGGSALVMTLALIGLLMNVSMRRYVF